MAILKNDTWSMKLIQYTARKLTLEHVFVNTVLEIGLALLSVRSSAGTVIIRYEAGTWRIKNTADNSDFGLLIADIICKSDPM